MAVKWVCTGGRASGEGLRYRSYWPGRFQFSSMLPGECQELPPVAYAILDGVPAIPIARASTAPRQRPLAGLLAPDIERCPHCRRRLREPEDWAQLMCKDCRRWWRESTPAILTRLVLPQANSDGIQVAEQLLSSEGDPEKVRGVWKGLLVDQQVLALASSPELGNLDGVPLDARDHRNRVSIQSELDKVLAENTIDEAVRLDRFRALDYAMSNPDDLVRHMMPGPSRTHPHIVVSYHPPTGSNAERLALGHGWPSSSKRPSKVAVYVPGMLSTVEKFPALDSQWAGVKGALDLVGEHFTQQVPRIGAVDLVRIVTALMGRPLGTDDPGSQRQMTTIPDNSSDYFLVTWLDYDAPGASLLMHRSGKEAITAARRLAVFAESLRIDGFQRIVLHGFSYGSVVVTATARELASRHLAPVTRLIIAGSPGTAFQTAGQVGMEPENIINFRGYADIVSTRSLGYQPDDRRLSSTIIARSIVGRLGLLTGHSNPAADLRKRNKVIRQLESREAGDLAAEVRFTSRRSVLFQYAWAVAAESPASVIQAMPHRSGTVLGTIASIPRAPLRPFIRFLNRRPMRSNLRRYDEAFGPLPFVRPK